MKKGISLKSIIIAGVSALSIVCVFLPWVSANVDLGFYSFHMTKLGIGCSDGVFFLAGSIIVAALALIAIKKEDMHTGFKVAMSVISALFTVIAIIDIIDAKGKIGGSVSAAGIDLSNMVSVGIGLYLVTVTLAANAVLPWIPIKVMLGGDKSAVPEGTIAMQAPVVPQVPVVPQAPVVPQVPVVPQAPVAPQTPEQQNPPFSAQ